MEYKKKVSSKKIENSVHVDIFIVQQVICPKQSHFVEMHYHMYVCEVFTMKHMLTTEA